MAGRGASERWEGISESQKGPMGSTSTQKKEKDERKAKGPSYTLLESRQEAQGGSVATVLGGGNSGNQMYVISLKG